jgi:pre-rRNA-processing protein TSR2
MRLTCSGGSLDLSPSEGIRQIFMRWTALCLAVEQEWGGRSSTEKANSLQGEILEWFYSRKGEGI